MSGLSFSLSHDAIDWIIARVQLGHQRPEFRGFVPALYQCFNYQVRDDEDRVVEWYGKEFVNVGWYPPADVATDRFVEVVIADVKVFVERLTMEHLKGTQLVLMTAQVGFPTPAAKTVQLLTAITQENKGE